MIFLCSYPNAACCKKKKTQIEALLSFHFVKRIRGGNLSNGNIQHRFVAAINTSSYHVDCNVNANIKCGRNDI